MNTLAQQLMEITASLVVAAGTAVETMAALRRYLAACLIQQNPALIPIAEELNADPALLQAAREGEALAAELNAAAVRLRWLREPYKARQSPTQRPREVFGPFIDGELSLVQFSFFESAQFRTLVTQRNLGGGVPYTRKIEMLLPASSATDPEDPLRWNLPAGTVWLSADRIVPGTLGFVALRIAGGSLSVGRALAPPEADGTMVVPLNTRWALTIEPEPAPVGGPSGSDGNGLALELPSRLELRVSGLGVSAAPIVTGALALSGFGEPLRFETQTGVAAVRGDAIEFPFDAEGAVWRITGNRSLLCQADGSAKIVAAAWSLPLTNAPPEQAGEAANSGSIVLPLQDGPLLRLANATGACRAFVSVFSANAHGLEWNVLQSETDLSLDLTLWNPASSRLRCGVSRFLSQRNGADLVGIKGGRLVNHWDQPLSASNRPFEFDGIGEAVTMIAERSGLHRTAARASRDPAADTVQGYALENLYLHVRPTRQVAFVGSGAAPALLAEGSAQLVFDVRFAQPMLPDPYTNNWRIAHLDVRMASSALHVGVLWSAGAAPTLHPLLHKAITFPQQPADAALDDIARDQFRGNLDAERTYLALLDLSSRDHLFGITLETQPEKPLVIDAHDRLNWPLRHMRLLMQPQVHWEPVQVIANAKVGAKDEIISSRGHGGPTLVGAASVKLVPALPGVVGDEIVMVANGQQRAAALFGLPFGLRALALMERRFEQAVGPPPIVALLHQPHFVDRPDEIFEAARQLRLIATGVGLPRGASDPSRAMPGMITQTLNLNPNVNNLTSVLNKEVQNVIDASFKNALPLHQADLSGYGLSSFSRWRRALPLPGRRGPPPKEGTGVTQVRFDVLVGRTSYEVIELQSRLWAPQCRMVRTIILERRNSGRITRYDSGWAPIEDGECKRYAPIETGVVKAFRNIRNVRITPRPLIATTAPWLWQEVRYDADLHLAPEPGSAADRLVPIRDHVGFIQILPVDEVAADGAVDGGGVPGPLQFDELMKAVGHPIGGPLNAAIRLGGTLSMQLSQLAVARDESNPATPRFVLEVSGSPTLPRAGQWMPVRIDGRTGDVAPVDPRRGLPVIRREGEAAFVFRDAALAYQTAPGAWQAADEYGLLMSTPSSRVLFRAPSVTPGQGTVRSAPPLVADPCALTQSSGLFPRPAFVFNCQDDAIFQVTAADGWKLVNNNFPFWSPVPELAKGGEWALQRGFPVATPDAHPIVQLGVDTLSGTTPWSFAMPQPDELKLHIDGFEAPLLILRSAFHAASGGRPGFAKPDLEFGPALEAVKDIVDALKKFVNLRFDVDVDVAAGSGPSPSFVVRLRLQLRLPKEMHERIDIGVGKFQGRFEVRGELEAALGGATRGRISVEMHGDVQQAIIPPLLFAGGQFRFVVEINEEGKPLIELGLGTAASIGGDLIKNLVELEATVRYGYTLIPKTLQPGVMLGMEVRAKLLAGLLGLSFGVDAMARIQRVDKHAVTIWAELRAAATVQVAWLFHEEREIRTQFEQKLPLEAFALAAGANPIAVIAASELV